MGKKLKIFEEVKTFADFKQSIEYNIECLSANYMNDEAVEKALAGFNILSATSQQQLIDFVHFVDSYLKLPGSSDGNLFHKMPMILAASIYFEYYPETITDLTMDELAILSQVSIMRDFSFYEQAAQHYGKALLSTVARKVKEPRNRLGLMIIADKRLAVGQTKQEINEHITQTDIAQLNEETDSYCKQTLKKALGENLHL